MRRAASGPRGQQEGTQVHAGGGDTVAGQRAAGVSRSKGHTEPGLPGRRVLVCSEASASVTPRADMHSSPRSGTGPCYRRQWGRRLGRSQPPYKSHLETSGQGKTFPLRAVWNSRSAGPRMSANTAAESKVLPQTLARRSRVEKDVLGNYLAPSSAKAAFSATMWAPRVQSEFGSGR